MSAIARTDLDRYLDRILNGSEYGDAFSAYLNGADLDADFGPWQLDEFVSIARMHANTPVYAPILPTLRDFIARAESAYRRALQAPYAF